MNYHQESAFASDDYRIPALVEPPSNGLRLLVSFVLVLLTCLALTLLGVWPDSTKQNIWKTFVYLTPSQFVYAMDFLSRRRQRRGQGNVGFTRKDFGNQQAKSEALQRAFGLKDDSLATVAQRARRMSGLDKVLELSSFTPAGLGNWDNSCYQNSIIQSLASLPSFEEYLAQNTERMSQYHGRSTHKALSDIIGKLNHIENGGRRLWIPSVLKSMNSWQQQDAQEYFSRIIDEVDREISKFAKEESKELGYQRPADDDISLKSWQHNPFDGLLAQRVGCTQCGYTEGLSLLPFTCLTVNLGMQQEYDVRDCLDQYTALEGIEGVECIKCTVLRTKASLEHVLHNMDLRDASTPPPSPDTGSVSTLRSTVTERLRVIKEICEAGDFSDSAIYKTCNISAKSRVSSTKSKQAIVARPPKDLVIHVNRSIFDVTGMQRKNHARVRFSPRLNLGRWCLGSQGVQIGQELWESWNTSPGDSMLPRSRAEHLRNDKMYKLRAVITHYGGHENGHYIAYRKRPSHCDSVDICWTDTKRPEDSWYCFSDDVVSPVSEDHVLSQGGVFMLFYEAIEQIEDKFQIPAKPVVVEDMTTAPQAVPKSTIAGKDARTAPEETPETNPTIVESAPSARPALSGVDLNSPQKPLLSDEKSSSEEDSQEYPNSTQPESTKSPSIAPIMRTAGALSPNSLNSRRSSNISLHSPPFVTAS